MKNLKIPNPLPQCLMWAGDFYFFPFWKNSSRYPPESAQECEARRVMPKIDSGSNQLHFSCSLKSSSCYNPNFPRIFLDIAFLFTMTDMVLYCTNASEA